MKKQKLFNFFIIALVLYIAYLKAPVIFTNFQSQDKKATNFTLTTLDQKQFTLNDHNKKLIVIFWATWCGPCEIELNRLNSLVKDNKINKGDILAISIGEELATVSEHVQKNKYLFNIGLDSDNTISNLYNIAGTPTLIFIDANQKIKWMTAGLSPTLEFRAVSFLKN